jgi:tetraacyldisaccharide 4'-kinase
MQKNIFKNKKAFKVLLLPFAYFYQFIVFSRNKLFDLNLLKIKSLSKPVISIGNLTIGGTAKTPFTIFISNHLKSKGIKVAILSRGYGRKSTGTVVVSDGENILSSLIDSGDEPTLIARKTTDIPIVVDNNRCRGGNYLISKYNPDIIILDDGFQHRSLNRNLDILLVNSLDKKREHQLIPIGKLREPWKNYKRADILIKTKSNLIGKNNFLSKKVSKTNKNIFISESHIKISNVFTKKNLTKVNLLNKNVLSLTAIGDHKSFLTSIKKTGCNLIKVLNFRDHYNFNQKLWNKIEYSIQSINIEFILTTEKDWVKIEPLKRKTPIIIFELNITLNRKEDFFKILQNVT